jgi:hypothetical protein
MEVQPPSFAGSHCFTLETSNLLLLLPLLLLHCCFVLHSLTALQWH